MTSLSLGWIFALLSQGGGDRSARLDTSPTPDLNKRHPHILATQAHATPSPTPSRVIKGLPAAGIVAALVVLAACTFGTTPPRSAPSPDTASRSEGPSKRQPSRPPARGSIVRVREYAVPDGSGPHDVAPARDGTVWYTAQSSGELGRLDPETGRTDHIPLGAGSAPHGVIVGPDGAPWVTDGGLNAIVRVHPKTERVKSFPLPEGANANLNTATFDGGGVLWFTGQNGIYGRVDPDTGTVETFQSPRGAGCLNFGARRPRFASSWAARARSGALSLGWTSWSSCELAKHRSRRPVCAFDLWTHPQVATGPTVSSRCTGPYSCRSSRPSPRGCPSRRDVSRCWPS